MGAEPKDADTIPAAPQSKKADAPQNPSGVRAATQAPSASFPGDEAHAEMVRAVARGVCTILCSHHCDDGTTVEWSAWRVAGRLVAQGWFCTNAGHWSRGPSFVVEAREVAALGRMIEPLLAD